MKEKELLEKLAERWGIAPKAAANFLNDYHAEVKDALKTHGEVTINCMGKYVLQHRPERDVRNPATGQMVRAAAKTVAKWVPNKKFKDEMFGA